MKKNTLIALFAILTLALGGCSEKAEPAADTTTTAETTIEQTVTEEETAEETTEEAVVTEEITEEVTTEAAITAAPETTTEEVTATEEITTTEEIATTPETTPVETTTEEIVTKVPETTTQPAPETTPVQEETGLGKVTYNSEKYQILVDNVNIYPAEAWYEGEKFVVTCYITNGFNVDKYVTQIPKFIIYDADGNKITDASFNSVGVNVPAGGKIMHTFTFGGAALINPNADYLNISWDITANYSEIYVQ